MVVKGTRATEIAEIMQNIADEKQIQIEKEQKACGRIPVLV